MSGLGQRAIAYHEAGHAVVAAVLDVPFQYVTIIPTKKTLGCVKRRSVRGTPEEREHDALVRLAGSIAETKHTGWDNWEGAVDDYRGLGLTEEEARRLQNKARALLERHWPAVCRVTNILLVRRRLTHRRVLKLVEEET